MEEEGVMADNQVRTATEGVANDVLRDVKTDQYPSDPHVRVTALDADIVMLPGRSPRCPLFQHVLYVPNPHLHDPFIKKESRRGAGF